MPTSAVLQLHRGVININRQFLLKKVEIF